MARIALTTAAAGAMIGADLATGGLATGLMLVGIGLALGAALIPLRPPGQAPLQDLNVSSSANGTSIPFGYDTMRLAGQVIWSPGITYGTEATQSSGKGAQTPAGYVYFASFAAAFGEGPASIGRVWADSKLIYKGGLPFGTFAPWNPDTNYVPEDLVSYHWNPGVGGSLLSLFQCVVLNTNVSPPGNSLYWAIASYNFWDSSVQYEAGNIVAYPGKPTDTTPGSGQLYACIYASLGDHPDSSGNWQPVSTYFIAPTIYPGDEAQLPDPLIQGIQGVDNTPAFRGICYAVWELLPLANFGNRIPNLRAEITFGGPGSGGGGGGGGDILQMAQGYTGVGATTVTAAFPNPLSSGSLLVVFVYVNLSAAAAATISDTHGNTWTSARAGWDAAAAAWYSTAASGGADSVTVSAPGTNYLQLQMIEVAGSHSALRTSGHNSSSTGTPSVTASAPAVAGDYAVSFLWTGTGTGGYPFTAGPGYTLRQQQLDPSLNYGSATEDSIVAANGSVTASFGLTASTEWGQYLLVF